MTTPNTAELWSAVDQLTKATHIRIERHRDADELAEATAHLSFCLVADPRYGASHGVVPSLWEQAEIALETGREQQTAGGGAPLAERSPADLDLMEQMLTIRETMPYQLAGRGITPRATIPEQIRQLAAHIATHEPQHVEWWAYRLGQWARLLGTYLHAIDVGPRPVRLRNAPCPLCKTRQVTLDTDQGPVVTGPILVDFVNGWIRAATCTACTATWWRGDELNELADALARQDTPDVEIVAHTA